MTFEGYSMTTCDLDGDGHDDLVVGSPYARGQESQSTWERFIYQKGAVSVFLSSNQRHTGQTLDWMYAQLSLSLFSLLSPS